MNNNSLAESEAANNLEATIESFDDKIRFLISEREKAKSQLNAVKNVPSFMDVVRQKNKEQTEKKKKDFDDLRDLLTKNQNNEATQSKAGKKTASQEASGEQAESVFIQDSKKEHQPQLFLNKEGMYMMKRRRENLLR